MHPNIDMPALFLAQIEQILPSHLSMTDFVAACQRPLRRSIRVNTLKTSVEDFKVRAAEKGWTLTPVPWCETGFWIDEDENEAVPLGNTAEHMAGLFYIQEASSMLPVTALMENNQGEWERLLDMAAAPGSKTTQIAAAVGNSGLLVANEYSASRVKVLHANLLRCGVHNVALTKYDGRVFGEWLPETFDAILLDAPCSGEGTIRKDADAFANWSLEAVNDIANTQKDLIVSAFHALKAGGTLVYSTCTLSHEENQDVCHFLKQTFGDAVEFESLSTLFNGADAACTEEGFLHVFPQIFDSEGFFVARLRKTQNVGSEMIKKRPRKFPFQKAKPADAESVEASLKATLGIEIPQSSNVWLREKEVWIFPAAVESILPEIKFDRIGLKLAESHKNGYRWQHETIMALADGSEPLCVNLSAQDAKEWYMGRDIRPENLSGKGEVIVCYRNQPIGIGKWVGNRIKNGLPRELVRDVNLFIA
ncbi:16S rRNA (cytosine(1407)-C(5))-methyltransferase RsmF [Enterovibrio makurazakiensis]|uniref:Ribosomal RNA small subunit methyltransferase F n=1 Tax=Enterovibrio gelatinilyticus TaxID=2899819 RepID=A0ABT5QUI4_9GAMM|nr:16S rRNA (cytosine(1407)-C(5))-methyltransferase RsmF [Enterovibrio sp. ZSDZ42]MDD1791668.1 16S rRNA (cytosine(1407)-C(5))-methyltransferase RsmF [Enterovibrio sp. ZSDZ42]